MDQTTGATINTGNEPNFLNDYFVNISSRFGFGRDYPLNFENNNYLDMYSDIDDFFYISADLLTKLYCIQMILILLKVVV